MIPVGSSVKIEYDETLGSTSLASGLPGILEAEFEPLVLRASRDTPVVICFTAQWSAPGKSTLEALVRIALEARDSVRFLQADYDEMPHLVRDLEVRTLPDVRAYVDAVQVVHLVGHADARMLRRALDPVLRSTATLHALQALHAFAAGDSVEAEAEYRIALQSDPDHPAALLGLGRLLEEAGKCREAISLFARVPSDARQYRTARARLERLQRTSAHSTGPDEPC